MLTLIHSLAILTAISFVLWVVQVCLALADRRRQDTISRLVLDHRPTVTVVIPAFNEVPARLIGAVSSVMRQVGVVAKVIVVNDGSTRYFPSFQSSVMVIKMPTNVGKRTAQIAAFRRVESEWIVTMDSDTLLKHDDALLMLVKTAIHDDAVAASGTLQVGNANQNLLTRLTSLAYWYSYFQERASQSVFGCVAVCSGALSIYKTEFIEKNLSQYANQKYLGRSIVAGDDRMLTTLALLSGHRTTWSPIAVGMTHAPDTFRRLVSQQIRWTRSFIATLPMILQKIKLWRLAFGYWQFKQVFRYVYHIAVVSSVVSLSIRYRSFVPALYLLVALIVIGAAKGGIGFAFTRSRQFLLMPVAAIMSFFVTTIVFVVSLFTTRNNRWVTR